MYFIYYQQILKWTNEYLRIHKKEYSETIRPKHVLRTNVIPDVKI